MADAYGYCPIEDYGVIGDMNSAALVSRFGSIDWLCFPRFDSPSVFAAVLDPGVGGRFGVSVADPVGTHQEYVEDTNLLRTVLQAERGRLEVVDCMPCYRKRWELEAFHEVHRRLRCLEGEVTVRVHFQPRFHYGTQPTEIWTEEGGCLARSPQEWLSLATDLPLTLGDGACGGEEPLAEGDERWLVLRWNDDFLRDVADFRPAEKLAKTEAFWREWANRCTYEGPFRDLVKRSLLVLKLMVYEPTGAIVAAPTTSLPEVPQGEKNWDYRFSWLRDAAFTLRAFHHCGYTEEERGYRHWVMRRLRGHTLDPGELQIMYGVEGDTNLAEEALPHLRGYRDARPVRVGNAAHKQFQLDTYGSDVDTMYLSYHTDEDMTDDVWRTVEALATFVARNWQRPDSGIWELRGQERHYTYSKVMAWVALDRAARIARRWGNAVRAAQWEGVRDQVRSDVLTRGYDEALGSFVQYYGGKEVDGSLLILPIVFFVEEGDVRFAKTLETVRQELCRGSLVWRFREEGPREGAFLMLSFWLVDALTRSGRLEEAREAFEEVAGYANHLGLFAEMVDPETGGFLGNFPQAFTHKALINAAVNLWQAKRKPS